MTVAIFGHFYRSFLLYVLTRSNIFYAAGASDSNSRQTAPAVRINVFDIDTNMQVTSWQRRLITTYGHLATFCNAILFNGRGSAHSMHV